MVTLSSRSQNETKNEHRTDEEAEKEKKKHENEIIYFVVIEFVTVLTSLHL